MQEAKVAPARSELEALEQVIVIEGDSGPATLSLGELRERGRRLLASVLLHEIWFELLTTLTPYPA